MKTKELKEQYQNAREYSTTSDSVFELEYSGGNAIIVGEDRNELAEQIAILETLPGYDISNKNDRMKLAKKLVKLSGQEYAEEQWQEFDPDPLWLSACLGDEGSQGVFYNIPLNALDAFIWATGDRMPTACILTADKEDLDQVIESRTKSGELSYHFKKQLDRSLVDTDDKKVYSGWGLF
jgi:hypothetical protein